MEIYLIFLTLSSFVLGFVMHRSDFCIAGAFRDIWLFKRTIYIKAIFVCVSLNIFLFELFYQLGIIQYMPYPMIDEPNLGNILGGLMFGVGMVCSGSCIVGVLYKMGSGSIIAFISFIGIITGSCIYILFAEHFYFLKDILLFSYLTLNQLFNMNPVVLKTIILSFSVYFIFKWIKNNDFSIKSYAYGFINPLFAALIISIGSLISYIIAGMPMGVSTTYTKIGVFFMKLFDNEGVSNLEILHKYPLDFYNFFLKKRLVGGFNSVFDGIAIIQLPIILGIFLGSFLSSLLLKEFNLYFKIPLKQFFLVFIGGILMGLGARIGGGCNLWHIFGGLGILALNGIFFVTGLTIGSFFGSLIIKKVLK